MPVLNIAANQILPKPVSERIRNDLIRAQTAGVEKQTEQADAILGIQERQVEVSEKNAETAAGNLDQRIEEYGALVGEYKALEEANTIIGITEGAKSSKDPLAYANERMPEFIATLPEGEARAKLEKMAENGFSAEEMAELHGFSMAVNKRFSTPGGPAGYKAKDTYLGEDGKEYHMWYDAAGNIHKTGVLANDVSGNPTDFEPPNTAERAAAKAVIDDDPELKELKGDDEDIAIEVIASDIRQLQAAGYDYRDAAIMAKEKLKQRLIEEPSWFSSRKALDMSSKGLGDNEFIGKDGHTYIREPDGSYRRSD